MSIEELRFQQLLDRAIWNRQDLDDCTSVSERISVLREYVEHAKIFAAIWPDGKQSNGHDILFFKGERLVGSPEVEYDPGAWNVIMASNRAEAEAWRDMLKVWGDPGCAGLAAHQS